jgi:hypothetical protein
MLWTIALVLLVLWALGLVSSFTIGGFIHLLLVAAIVVVLIRVIQGRSVVKQTPMMPMLSNGKRGGHGCD